MKFLESTLKPGALNIIGAAVFGASVMFGASGIFFNSKFNKQQHETTQDSLIIKTSKSTGELTNAVIDLRVLLSEHIKQQDTSFALIKKMHKEMNGTRQVVTEIVKSNESMRKDFDTYFFMMYPIYNMIPISDSVHIIAGPYKTEKPFDLKKNLTPIALR